MSCELAISMDFHIFSHVGTWDWSQGPKLHSLCILLVILFSYDSHIPCLRAAFNYNLWSLKASKYLVQLAQNWDWRPVDHGANEFVDSVSGMQVFRINTFEGTTRKRCVPHVHILKKLDLYTLTPPAHTMYSLQNGSGGIRGWGKHMGQMYEYYI